MHCVLITGATGVIGSEVTRLFLENTDFQVRLILRAQSAEHLRARMAELHAYWEMSADDNRIRRIRGRLTAIAGDLCRPRLGLDAETYERLSREVTHIIHCAGNVKLNQSLDEARRNALDPARHLVALARTCQECGQFQKFDAVTTIGVAGRMQGLIPERPLTEPREFHNNYEQAKAETEDYLLEELATGLPLTIHRPSMVVGRSDNGKILHKQVFYYLCDFLTGKRTWGFLPDLGDATLDIIPVDYVARAIHISATQPDSIGRIFHLCSGPEHALRLTDLVVRLRNHSVSDGISITRLRYVPRRWFARMAQLTRFVSRGRVRRVMAHLPYFLAYLAECQSFAVADTACYFSVHGVESRPPGEYVTSFVCPLELPQCVA